MNPIQQLIESSNPWKSQQNDAMRLAKKWEKSGLLKGISNEIEKNNLSVLLETQAKQLLLESNVTSGGTATFTSGTGENWSGIALPMVRKIFGQIAAKDFLSVQPMNQASGLVFFLDFQYGSSKNPFNAGGSLYGQHNSTQFPFSTTGTQGGLYGAGRFGYTINQFSSSAVTATITSASWADVNFDSELSSSIVGGTIKKLSVATATASVAPYMDKEGARAFMLVSGSVGSSTVLQAFTKYTDSTDTLSFFVTASTAQVPTANAFVLYYNKQTKDNLRGDFEDGNTFSTPNAASATDIVIPAIDIKMRSEGLIAKTRKLKAQWTPEFAQDLNSYQNLDAEAELTSIISEYISLETDLELLDMMISDAPQSNTDYWSAINNTVINNTQTGFETLSSGYYNSQGQWFQTLGTKIQKISNKIHQATLRGGANFMVMSPTVATIIESIPGFASNSDGDVTKKQYAFGVQKSGQLNGKFNIYKNPYMTENLIFLGFRGSQFLEAGAVFAPYIPLIMTPLVYDPETYTPSKGLFTRNAKKMLRPEFFGKLYINGLNAI
jgi:hypothetical protein